MKRLLFLILIVSLIPRSQMGQGILPFVEGQFFSNTGAPLALGKICTLQSGTSTPLATYPTYADAVAETNANSNPVTLDAYGRANIWLGPNAYRIIIHNAGTGSLCNGSAVGSAIKTIDGVTTSITNITAPTINNVQYCSAYAGSDAAAKINACMAALPSTGGIADARGIQGAQTASTTITISKPVQLLLGAMTLTVSAGPAIDITSSNAAVVGSGATKLVNTNNVANAGPMIQADFGGLSQASNITIASLQLIGGTDTTNCYKRGIQIENVTQAIIKDNVISGVDVPPAGPGDAYGIYFPDLTTFSTIENNVISFDAAGAVTDVGFRIGILLQSPMTDAFNGQVSGDPATAATTTDNIIRGNKVFQGTHAYDLQNTSRTTIVGNSASAQIRNLIVFATNANVLVTGNSFSTATSTNMAFDYGNDVIAIVGNTLSAVTGGEGNAIELYYNNNNATISGNSISGFTANGIFIAYKANNISVTGNTIYSATSGVNGIGVVGALPAQYTVALASPDTQNITIKGNRIYVPTSASNGVKVTSKETGSTLDPVNITNVVVDNNDITATGSYGVFFLKNSGTGTFTPTMGANNKMFITTGISDGPFGSDYNVVRTDSGTAAPANGNWGVGSIRFNTAPATPGYLAGWINVAAGNPGTWVEFGGIRAYNDAGTRYGAPLIMTGETALSSGTTGGATITFSIGFSDTAFECTTGNKTSPGAVQYTITSSSTVDLVGPGDDTVTLICIGA